MGKVDNVLYQFWTGNNEMSKNRAKCLQSAKDNIRIPVKLVTPENLSEYILPEHPLPDYYECLTYNHRSDYLRCYFMHFHGGVYADIKYYGPGNNFDKVVGVLNENDGIDVVGKRETPGWAAVASYNSHDILPHLLATPYLAARPGSRFTERWYRNMRGYLDVMSERLKRHPMGDREYPIPYLFVMGLPYHVACLETYRENPLSMSYELKPDRKRDVPYR